MDQSAAARQRVDFRKQVDSIYMSAHSTHIQTCSLGCVGDELANYVKLQISD